LLQVIPPEDIVAAFQGRRTLLFATASTAADAQVYLEVLIRFCTLVALKLQASLLSINAGV
jgi:3-dehydroquinate synthase class II